MVGDVATKTQFPVWNGYAPQQGGPKAIPIVLDFTSDSEIDFDLVDETARELIGFVQSMWVDNADNSNELTLTFSQTGQRVKVAAGAQGMYPIISPSGLRCKATTTAVDGLKPQLILLNVPMPLSSSAGGGGGSANSSATFTRKSAILTGASDTIIAANAARKGYIIENPSTNANSIWVGIGAAATADYLSYEIMPGGNLPPYLNFSTAAINVIGTNGQHVTAYELT